PDVPLLFEKGDAVVKDPICRAHDLPDDSLIIDPETKGVANAFVFLSRAPESIHPDLQDSSQKKLVFDQQDCRFEPHAMVVQTNQTVLVKSNDPTNHNAHTHPLLNSPQNFLVQPLDRDGVPLTFPQREPTPVKVNCDIHPWMTAWWLVVDHPYAAVTNDRGEFSIENLPAGEHTFRVWHERAQWIDKSLRVTITDGETTELPPIQVAADLFQAN
ncbi:unnamed protein product, partial [marine sediment metagenome]